MIEIKLDLSQFADAAKRMGAAVDQTPYALSRALNDAAFATRERLIHSTWPEHVKQRRSNFPGAVLRVERSNKIDLTVTIRDVSDKGQGLRRHETATGTASRNPARIMGQVHRQWYIEEDASEGTC
jgi:hypothetical protein